ncbi:hypothetical protein K4F52_001448 [Lecanicillium sp. MT-2017a]|nr:hypothetical protein K4F52_001448 [Lecanicillium sp. MT-2017a]
MAAHPVSYANAASKGAKQPAEEKAAPQPPEVLPNESASTSSLIDVDAPSVHTVPSDFMEQDVQTDTQAHRLEREASAAKAKAERAKKAAAGKAKKADSWLTKYFSQLSDGAATGVGAANLAALVGVSSYLGYRAWVLYDKGRLSWGNVGAGFGILAAVGAVEAFIGTYIYKGKKRD